MSTANSSWHTMAETSLGTLTLVRDDAGLRGLYFPQHWHLPNPSPFGPSRDEGFDDALAQLTEYLAGTRRDFQLPLAPCGPDRQLRLWALIRQIGYGRTTTYGDLAREMGGGATPREVGGAVGRNPLSIFIPCHRVIGRDGKLTGYAGGLVRKRYLLDLEMNYTAQPATCLFPTDLVGGKF